MPDISTNFVRACSGVEPCPFCDTGGCVNRPRQTILTTYPPMPDPASGMEMDPEFVRLVQAVEDADFLWRAGADSFQQSARDRVTLDLAREALHRWHLAAVERAKVDAFNEGVDAMKNGALGALAAREVRRG